MVRHPFVLAGSDGPASRARAVRHSLFLFRGCRRPAARGPLLARVCPVPVLALVFVAACSCAPPPPHHPALPLVVLRPPLCFLVSQARRRLCPPPPRGMLFPAGWANTKINARVLRAPLIQLTYTLKHSVSCGHGCVVGLAGVGVCPLPCWGVPLLCVAPPWWGVLCRRVRVSVRGVVAGWMPGWFCWFAVVCAAVRPALSGAGCLWCWPGRGWCSAGACPPPPLLGRAVLVRAPPLGGGCCFGPWPPSSLGRAVLVATCCGGGVWFGLSSSVG